MPKRMRLWADRPNTMLDDDVVAVPAIDRIVTITNEKLKRPMCLLWYVLISCFTASQSDFFYNLQRGNN